MPLQPLAPALVPMSGTDDRLAELCQRYYGDVQRRVHRLLSRDIRRGRPWLAALLSTGDIVHEVFLGVTRDYHQLRGTSDQAFVAYLARLVRNRLIDSVRHHEAARRDQRRTEPTDGELAAGDRSPGSKLSGREDVEDMHRILAQLPERDRALLHGRLEDGESFLTLARSLGYASADSARKAFAAVQARVLTRLQLGAERRR
jgi:RNA polymerase sigma factor (sigma-70 family)